MSNMSYCRFQNVSRDLADCVEALRDAVEEGEELTTFLASLADGERDAVFTLERKCRRYLAALEELRGGINPEDMEHIS